MFDHLTLHKQDREQVWLAKRRTHGMCTKVAEKTILPQYGGLQPTIQQQARPFKPLPEQSLQINGNHWVAVSTVNREYNEDIIIYAFKHSLSRISTACNRNSVSKDGAHREAHNFGYCHKTIWLIDQTMVRRFAVAYLTCVAFGKKSISLCLSATCYEKPFPKLPRKEEHETISGFKRECRILIICAKYYNTFNIIVNSREGPGNEAFNNVETTVALELLTNNSS